MSNVRVAVRVRPLNRRELGQDERFVVSLSGDAIQIENLKVGGGHDFVDSRERVKRFTFDYCYNSAVEPESPDYAGQELIFQDLGTEVLQAAFEGYNACVFAYGQTGSGKTYTMMGQDPEEVGLTPRICEGLFARVDDFLEADDISFRVDISYLEIYNERVRDLLHSRKADKYTLKVREHPKQGPYVQDLSHHLVKNNAEIQSLLYRGNESRTTAVTHMHEHSSRSHAIITVTFTQARLEDDMPSEIVSKLHLVDLAGSERADKTCKTNYKGRLKEGANINKSLTTLGNVIKALAEKSILSMSIESLASSHSVYSSSGGDSQTSPASSPKKQRTFHIPYRDSVLTWLLKDSLGGNSKTIMIATVSPGSCHYSESLSTLRYAQRAQDIINEPKVNEDCSVTLIRELKREIERLRQMLCTAQMSSSQSDLIYLVPIKRCRHVSSGSDSDEMNSLIPIKDTGGNFIVEKLQENEARANELTQSWIEKWHETHDILSESDVHIRRPLGRRTSSQGVIVDSELPHLIGVDDDILSTGITLYYLKDGKTRIGREDACRLQDIVLHGPCIMREHCIIRNVLGTVTLYPNKGALCSVNGIYVKEPTRLTQGNTILLGKTHMFRFNHPKEAAQLREHRKKLHSCGSLTSNSSDDIQHSHLNASASSLSPMSLLSRSAELDRTYSTDPERIAQAQCEIKHIHEQESTTDQLCYEKQREIETLHAKHLNDLEQQRHHLAKLIDERQEERIKDEEQLDEAKRELEKERLQNQQQLDQELDQLQWFRHNRRFQETTTQTDNSTCTTSSTNTSITQVDETDGCSSDVFKETEELVQKKLSLEGHLKSLAQQELVRELRLRHIEENIARQEEKLEKHFDETQDQITQQTGVIRQLEDSYQHDESRISVDMAKQLRQLESLQKKEERLELYIEEKVDLLSVEMALPHPLREAISYEYLTSADIALADSVNHLSERRGSDGDLPSTGHMYAVPSSSCLSTASSMDSLTSSVESVSAFSRTDSPNSQPSDLSSSTHTSPKYCITQKAQSVTDRLYRPPPLSQRSHSTSDVNSGANQKRGATTPLLRYSLRKRPSRKHKDIESPVSKLEKTNTPVKHAKVGLNTKISFSKTPQISRTSSLASVPEAVEDAGNLQQFMPTIPVVLRTRRRRLTDEEESRRHSAPVGDKLASALELYTDEMNNAGSLVSLSDGQHFTDSLDPVSSLVWTSHIGKPISVDDNVYRRPKCSDGENVFSEWQSSDTLNPLLSTNKATKNLIIPIITVTDESSCAHNNHTIHISDQTDSVSQDLHETGSSPVFNVPGMDDETVTNHITANSCLDNRLNVDSDSIVHKISDNDDEAEEYFSADSLNDCEISNRSHKDAFSNQILSTSQLCDQIEADNDIVYIAETAQSTDKEYLAASISLYRQNDCETTDKFDILTCTNVSIETEPQENIPTPLSVLSKENTNIEMNPTYSEFLENQELTWTSEMTNHDPGDDQFMRLSNSDIVPDATSNSELAPAGTKSRNGDEEEKEEEEEEEEHKRKMDDEFSADSLQETEEQSKTQTTVNRRMAKQLRQKNGARQQHPRWTEVENADLLSDDSLASGHNSHNSRPNSGAKRRRRLVAKLSASNAIKKRRDNSSEECTSSDNDSIFSDDSLTYADNKEDTLQASSICDRTLRSTVIDNDVMTNTDSQSLIRTFVSVTESVDMLTNALQDDIPDDDLSQSNLKSKDLSPLADINQSIDDSSSEATGVVENDVLETSGSFSVANFHEPTFRLVTSDTSIASAVSQSKLQRLALSNINVVSTEDMSKTNQDSEREMPRSVIYAKHNDILEAKDEVCDMIVEQAEPLSSTSPVQLQLVSNEVEVNVEYNMQRIEYNAQGLIKRNVNDDQAILPIQLTTSALPERIEIILTETKTVKVEERHVSERKEQLCIHGYDDNGVAILESLIKEQNFHTSIESLHEIITENGRVSRENSSERVLEDQDSKHYHLPAFDQENHVFNGSCEGNAKSAIEPETSIKQSGSVNIDICSEESLIQCPNCVSDHFVSNSGDSSKSSTANNDFNDLDNASKGCCESIAGVPDTDFHPANRHSFNVISSDSDILHKHTDTHSFMPHFANDLDGHVVSESGDSGYSDSVKHDDDSISSKYKNLTTHILLNNSDYNATKNRCDCIVFGDTLNAIQPRVIAYEENMSAAEQPSEHRRLAIINIVSQEAVFVPRFENSSIDNILVQSVPVIVSEKMDVSQDELIIFKALPGIHQGPVTFNVGGIQKQNEVIPDEVIPESDFASKNPELRAQTDIYTNQFQESTECMSPQISNSHSFQDHKVLSDSSSGAELKYDCVKILTEKIPSVYSMPDTVANALLFPDNDSKVEEISTLDHIGGIQSRSTSTELYNSDLQTSGDAIVKDGNVISCDAVPLQHVSNSIDNVQEISERLPGMYDLPLCHFHDQTACPVNGNALTVLDKVDGCILGNDVSSESSLKFASGTPSSSEIQEHIRRVLDSQLSHLQQQTRSLSDSAISSDYTDGESANVSPRSSRMQDVGKVGGEASNVANRLTWPPTNRDTVHGNLPGTDLYEHDQNCIVAGFEGFCMNKQTGMVYGNESLHTVDILDNERMLNVNDAADIYSRECGNVNDNGRQTVTDNAPSNGSRTETNVDCDKHSNKGYSDDNESDQSDGQDPIPPRLATERFSGGNSTNMDGIYFSTLVNIPVVDGRQLQFPDIEGDSSLSLEHEPVCNAPSLSDLTDDGRHIQKWGSADSVVITMYESQPAKRTKCTKEKSKLIASQKELTETDHLSQNRLFVLFSGNGQNAVSSPAILVDSIQDLDHEYVSTVSQSVGTVEDNLCIDTREECLEVNPPIYSGGDRHQEQTKSGREKSPSLPDMISEVVHQLRQSSVSAEELHLSDTDDLNTADSSDSITFIFLNGSTTPVKQGLKEDGSKHSVYTPTTVNHNHSGEEHVVHMRHKYGINSQILPLSERTVSSDNLPKLSQKDTVKRRHSSADFSRSKPYSQVTNDQEAFPPFADDRTDGSEVEIDNELQPLAAKQCLEQFDDAEATFPSCFAETIEVSQAEVTNLEDEISFYIDTPTNVSQADASFEMLDHTSTSTKIGLRSPDSDRGSSFVSSAVFPEVFTSLEASPISPHEFVDWETVPHPVENSSIHQTDFLMTDIPASDSKDEQPDSSASTDTSGLCMSHDNSFLLSSLQERRPFLEFSLPFVTSLDRSPTSPRHIYRRFLDACVGTDFQVRDSQMQTNNHILMATEAEVESWIPGSMDLVERGTTMEHDLSCMTVSRGVDTMTTHLSSATQTSNLTGISVGSLSPGEVASPRHLSRSQSFSSLERISGQDRINPEPIGFNSELQTLSALMLETSNLLKAVHDRLPDQHGIHQETEIQTVKVKDFLTQTSSSLTDLHSVDVQTDELDESEILTLNTDLSVSDVNSLSIESASQLFSSMYVQTDRDVLHRTDAETQTDLSAILVPLRSMVQTQYSVTETSSIDPVNLNDFPEQMVDDILPDTGLLKDGSLIEDHCEAEINVITEFQTRSQDSTDRIGNGEMDAKYNTGNVITGDQQLNTNLHSIETPEISYNRDMVEYEDNNFRQQRAVNESTETLDYDAEDMAVVKFSDGYDNKSSYEHGQNKNDAGERQDVLQVSHPVQLIDIPKYGFDTAVEPAERDMTACDADDTSSFHYSIETLLRKSDKLSQTNPDMADLVKLILSRQQRDNDTGSSSSICSTDFQSDIDKLQREGLEILELLSLNYLPSSLTVELLEAKLNYCIGQTDLLLASLEDTDSDSDETNKQHGANVVEVVSVSMSNDNKEKRRNDTVVKSVAITCTSEEVHSNTIPVTVNDSRDNRSVTTTSKSTTNTESQPDHADDVLIENSLEVLEKSRKHISNANLGEAAKEPHGKGRGRTLVRNWDLLAAKKRAEMEAFRLERMREQNEYLRKSLSPLKNTETATSTHSQSGAVNDISPLVMTPHQHKDHMVQLRQSLVKKVVEEDHQRSQSPNRSLPRSRSRSSTSSRPVTLSRETSPDINPADYLYRFNEILFGPESNYCAQNNPLSDHSSGETGIQYASNRRHSVSDGISADVKSTSLDRTLSITDYSKRIQNLSISVAATDATMQPGNRIDHCGAMKSSQMHARSWSAEDSSRRVSPGGYGALASHPSPLNTSLALNSPRGSYEMYANSFVRDCQETHSRAVEAISAAKEALYRRPSISNSIQHNSFFVPSSIERIKQAETHSVSPRRDISNKAIDHEIDELRRQLKNRYPSLSSPRQKYTSASTATYRESISRGPVSYDSFASYTSPRNRNVRSYDSSPSSYSAYANGLIDRSENTIHNLTQRHSHSTGAHDRLDRTTLASTRHYHDSYANTIAGMSNSTSTNNRHDKTHLSSYGSTRYSGNIRTPKAFSRMVRAYNGGSQF